MLFFNEILIYSNHNINIGDIKLKEVFFGFLVGLGKIIPGVSGAMIAISLGIYKKLIDCIIEPLKNIKYIITIGTGFLIAVSFGSRLIMYFMNKYFFFTMMFFIGLIGGGVPQVLHKSFGKKVDMKCMLVSILTFLIIILLAILKGESTVETINYPFLILIGFIEAFTMIIPGISGTAVLMIIGYYNIVMNFLNNLLNFSKIVDTIKFSIPFGIGLLIGVYIVSKFVKYLMEKHEKIFYSGMLGFVVASILVLFKEAFINGITFQVYLISSVILVIGFTISYKFDK